MPGAQLQELRITRPLMLPFTGMDASCDLRVSSDEMTKGVTEGFARADVDRSGLITGFETADRGKSVMGDPGPCLTCANWTLT